jgi:hypothetical protein
MVVENLMRVIEGVAEVSTDQIMHRMVFRGFGDQEETMKSWLRQILEDGGNKFRMDFLHFVTALKSMPPGGFNDVHHISVAYQVNDPAVDEKLPIAHTCHFHLTLPNYSSIKVMKRKLETAVEETVLLLDQRSCRIHYPPYHAQIYPINTFNDCTDLFRPVIDKVGGLKFSLMTTQ